MVLFLIGRLSRQYAIIPAHLDSPAALTRVDAKGHVRVFLLRVLIERVPRDGLEAVEALERHRLRAQTLRLPAVEAQRLPIAALALCFAVHCRRVSCFGFVITASIDSRSEATALLSFLRLHLDNTNYDFRRT